MTRPDRDGYEEVSTPWFERATRRKELINTYLWALGSGLITATR